MCQCFFNAFSMIFQWCFDDFSMIFDDFLELLALWAVSGPPLGRSWGPSGARLTPARVQGAKSWFVGPPPPSQNEVIFGSIFDDFSNKKVIDFCMDFGEDFSLKMIPKLIPKPLKNPSKVWLFFFIVFLMDFSVVLRMFWGSPTLIFAILSMRKRVF